jgi:hypothetical protein
MVLAGVRVRDDTLADLIVQSHMAKRRLDKEVKELRRCTQELECAIGKDFPQEIVDEVKKQIG